MDRYIQYDQEQVRTFDQNWLTVDAMVGLARFTADALGQTITLFSGLAATASSPATLTVNLAAGDVYQFAPTDSTPFSQLPANATNIMQQGSAPAQPVTLITSGLSAGQSQWVLIEAQFAQVDSIRVGDPTDGLLLYFNSSNPTQPYQGPGNDGLTQPTVRQGAVTIRVVYGLAATTGSEVPPNPDSGFAPLYLIDLSFGQTAIVQNQILLAGPSVGTGVPSNYPFAPLLAGLLNSHHGGTPGQAPKIILGTETQGTLPSSQLPVGVRQPLVAAATFYVNASTGNDSNNGLTPSTAWLTLQGASDNIQTNYDLNGQLVTVSCTGAFTAGVVVNGPYYGSIRNGAVTFSFQAGSTISGNVAFALGASFGASFNVTGPVTISNTETGVSGTGIVGFYGGLVNILGGMTFGNSNWAHIAGNVTLQGNYTVSGSAPFHYLASNSSVIRTPFGVSVTVTVTGTPAFSNAFAEAYDGGQIIINSSNLAFSGSATGARYFATRNGNINTSSGGANYFPGNSAGSTTSGGQYN